MASFNSGKNIAVVIQCQKDDEKGVLSLLEQNASSIFGRGRYAYILHDKDVLDNGDIKGKHIHLVLWADLAKSSQNWVRHFSEFLKVSPDAVSVEMMGSEKKILRYLLHLDDPIKHQYDRSAVYTNAPNDCKKAWDASSGFTTNPTLEQLEEAVKGGASALYNLVGLAGFEKAKRVADALHLENTYVLSMEQEIKRLYDTLCGFTANAKYLRSGCVPLKDFQEALDACSTTLARMHEQMRLNDAKKGK